MKIFAKKFGSLIFLRTFAIPNEKNGSPAEVAQLVEHNLAKVGVASSSLVFCSKNKIQGHLRMTLNFENNPTGYNYMQVVHYYGRLFLAQSQKYVSKHRS